MSKNSPETNDNVGMMKAYFKAHPEVAKKELSAQKKNNPTTKKTNTKSK